MSIEPALPDDITVPLYRRARLADETRRLCEALNAKIEEARNEGVIVAIFVGGWQTAGNTGRGHGPVNVELTTAL
jgi:hypothetical protein